MHRIEKIWELPFAIDRVYAAWTSSSTVIPPATRMDILPEVGGHYRLFMDTSEYTGRNEGKFLRVEPGARLTYTWEWNGDGEVSTIDVTFSASEKGTQVKLVHEGFSSVEGKQNHSTGWDSYMEGFVSFLKAQ